MPLSPVVLFVYNRPEHTRQTVEALQKNELAKDSDLFVFSDGPKNIDDLEKVKLVRDYLKTISGFKNISITESKENYGLARSIVNGVTAIINLHGKVIVLEDDIVTSPFFLTFMNDALNFYKDEGRVMHISGYMFPVKEDLPKTFFYGPASCWGWGTWKRAWANYNDNAGLLMEELDKSNRKKEFDLDDSGIFLYQLQWNIDKKINSWAIKWYASIFLKKGLCLHPGKSLVNNIGHDGSGVHSGTSNCFEISDMSRKIRVEKIPLVESNVARQAMINFYKKLRPSLFKKIFNFIKSITK